jgi:hypothetical protein
MKKIQIEKLYMPSSPLLGSSTRRNCPCCEESWDLAALDTPTPKAKEKDADGGVDQRTAGFRIIFKYYSSGSLHRVVRRRPLSLYESGENNNSYSRSFFNSNIKKLTINPKIVKGFKQKKSQNPVFKEKETASVKVEEYSAFQKGVVDLLWEDEERKCRKSGGLNKLQKVLRRSNLPPLATSIKDLRVRKFKSFNC